MPEIRTRDGTTYRDGKPVIAKPQVPSASDAKIAALGRQIEALTIQRRTLLDDRIKVAGSNCKGCPRIGAPSGTTEPACMDRLNANYQRRVVSIESCRRWGNP